MVVHLGVVVMALAIVTSTSYTTRNEVTLATGQSTVISGQYITFHGFHTLKDALETATQLRVDVNHHALLPAITTYNGRSVQPVGTPAIDSSLARDVYITFDAVGGNGAASGAQVEGNLPAGSVVLGVTVEPLLAWLWIGGLLLGVGSALSFIRRRQGEDVDA
jgi:cytochrome c-type biogenesis protein CcmF